jgi:archaemetzincin
MASSAFGAACRRPEITQRDVPARAAPAEPSVEYARSVLTAMKSTAVSLGPPLPGDWLASFPEPEQTFEQYLETEPTTARGERRVLYVLPLGEFTPARRKIIDLTADFMGRYFGLPVVVRPNRSLTGVPDDRRRLGPFGEQVLAGHVLGSVLRPELPDDAAAYIALTSADLYPEPSWNFVFGQANLRERVGVWSIARYGDPETGADAFRLCLLRTLKVAVHETGHMFSMPHCALYSCSMNGSNSLPETDLAPLELCPECAMKLYWATGANPSERLSQIAEFCGEHHLLWERISARRAISALREAGFAERVPETVPSTTETVVRAAVEARHASQASALRARLLGAYFATLAPDFSIRFAGGTRAESDQAFDALRQSWAAPRSVARVALRVEDFAASGDEAVALVRQSFDKTALWRDGRPRRLAGEVVQREAWSRIEGEWVLRRLEEDRYEDFTVDGEPAKPG